MRKIIARIAGLTAIVAFTIASSPLAPPFMPCCWNPKTGQAGDMACCFNPAQPHAFMKCCFNPAPVNQG
jgi:hypothetical protein